MDEPTQQDQKFFGRQARKRHLALIWARRAGLTPGMTILDIGSGPGFLAAGYAALTGPTGRVYALDPRLTPAEPAENLLPLLQDARAPIHLPVSPDTIFLTDTLHHAADPAAILASVHAACSRKTRLFIAEYDPEQPGLVGAKPHRRMTRARLTELVEAAGFTIVTCEDAEDEHYAVIARPT
jgi:2-polyprenyl-3-methyl-5-hydroxy-6-metoxy-1,4-benzoquinol methylase